MPTVHHIPPGDFADLQPGSFIILPDRHGACFRCGKTKKLARFKSRPRQVAGRWNCLDLGVCDSCRRKNKQGISSTDDRSGAEGGGRRNPLPRRGTVGDTSKTPGGARAALYTAKSRTTGATRDTPGPRSTAELRQTLGRQLPGGSQIEDRWASAFQRIFDLPERPRSWFEAVERRGHVLF